MGQPAQAGGESPSLGVGHVRDYLALLKPRVMSLVVFTGFVGLLLAPGSIHPVLGTIAILCIAVGAGASGAINMWYDRDIDAIMRRTQGRPIVTGRVDGEAALAFGIVLSAFSVMIMGLAVNWTAAALLALTIGFYVLVYTMWLKRSTPQNIVIGGAAGAFPPMIGWAAVTGDISLDSAVLFAIIFMWTPPHFWALSLYRCEDYARAGVPMLPVVAGKAETRRQILLYSLLLAPLAVLPWGLGTVGALYGMGAIVLGALFLLGAVRIWREGDGPKAESAAKQLFAYSILYLFLIFALMILDRAWTFGAAA
ncbi:heme o synthase [Oceanibaculum pacificum]|uniref:Protoheme IX farnesyltransferase n=1 Tax=Oceanibaculum pacificum TaxID=580166 RepID=A0A154VNG0_9PROT|nr:heme o synthase [Oceanibaculum pacificum]KZD02872.1 protoheme IX farnesyltransferase [Oceanibaculum pacificum]